MRKEVVGNATLYCGDCRDVLRGLADAGFLADAIVTDPPAGIGFMGKEWDKDKGGRDCWIEWMQEIAAASLRCVRPGAHALVWALPRTSHWTATAWENAGWAVRERISHLFGTGFPKSHNLEGDWKGWGTALKPACEDWWLLRAPLAEKTVAANVLAHGTGALNIDGCRVAGIVQRGAGATGFGADRADGYEAGTGREYTEAGRWPANVIHDGSDEVEAAFARFPTHSAGAARDEPGGGAYDGNSGIGFAKDGKGIGVGYKGFRIGDGGGSPSRFFYCAKASVKDRAGSKHPTVKPLALMRYLCRLVTPPGGTILDPFGGSGTTAQAAHEEGFRSVTIEREPEYQADILRRIEAAQKQPSLLVA